MNGKDSRSRNLNLPEYIARGSRVAQIFNSSLSLSLSLFFFYSFQSPTRPGIQMRANRKHLG